MMNLNFNHSITKQQPMLGGLAYWSVFTCATMINSDREPKEGLS
jgi:hypothetical protein